MCAGLADMTRPADKLSLSQSGVLTATGETGFEWDSSDLSSSVSLNLSIYFSLFANVPTVLLYLFRDGLD